MNALINIGAALLLAVYAMLMRAYILAVLFVVGVIAYCVLGGTITVLLDSIREAW